MPATNAVVQTNKQLIGEVREPLPVAPGQPDRVEHYDATSIFWSR